jgi:hypothetical protein
MPGDDLAIITDQHRIGESDAMLFAICLICSLECVATMEEIMEVLKLCVVQGVQACNLGVPILAEELGRSKSKAAQAEREG